MRVAGDTPRRSRPQHQERTRQVGCRECARARRIHHPARARLGTPAPSTARNACRRASPNIASATGRGSIHAREEARLSVRSHDLRRGHRDLLSPPHSGARDPTASQRGWRRPEAPRCDRSPLFQALRSAISLRTRILFTRAALCPWKRRCRCREVESPRRRAPLLHETRVPFAALGIQHSENRRSPPRFRASAAAEARRIVSTSCGIRVRARRAAHERDLAESTDGGARRIET